MRKSAGWAENVRAIVAVRAGVLLLGAVCLLMECGAQAQFLDAPTQLRVRAATFEVVVPKPVADPLTYEKPLPFDLQPYQIRTDKYFPFGTAFAIGGNRYVTAGHVFAGAIGSQYDAPVLRDGQGRVYAIDKILKYSQAEDFVVFSLRQDPAVAPLEAGPPPTLNETVYVVGNALGEGVVIRDGLYTSDTPEQRDGRWKWLRFSAAASPGNSGGPLLDKDGKVIGVVLAKSPNENLNYAVSIDQVLKAKDNLALYDYRALYQLDIFNSKQNELVERQLDLPKSFAEFSDASRKVQDETSRRLLQALLHDNAEHIFPKGEGSIELLHTLQSGTFPALISRGEDGTWHESRPVKTSRADLGHNGWVAVGSLKNNVMLHMHRPDDLPAGHFYDDGRGYMDAVLKELPLHRQMGPEPIRITSMGEPVADSVFSDSYGRKWQLRQWQLPFEDMVMVSMALPVPDGYVALLRMSRTAQMQDSIYDLRAMSDFVGVSYSGSLAQWRDFLKLKALQPAMLSDIALDFEYDKSFRYASPRFAFSFVPEVQKITADSLLTLNFSFFQGDGKVVLDVARARIYEESHSQDSGIDVLRHAQPAEQLNDSYKDNWNKILHRQHPYDAQVGNNGDLVYIHGVANAGRVADGDIPPVLYSVYVERPKPATQETMQAKLDRLMQDLKVNE